MKSRTILAALMLAAFSPASMASIVAADNFNYGTGELVSQSGGTGWAGAWAGVTSVTGIVTPGTSLVDGNALQVTGNDNNAAYRQLASAFTGGQLFVDFYVQIDSGSLTANDFLALWLDTVTTGDHSARPNIGIKADGSGSNDVFARTDGTGGSFVANSNIGSTNDVTHHIVGLLSKSGGNYNAFQVWLDPIFSDFSSPDATFNGNAGISQITRVGFRSANVDGGDVTLVDNLRLSTTWDEAMSVPEPATLSLLGLGLLGLRLGRRSNT